MKKLRKHRTEIVKGEVVKYIAFPKLYKRAKEIFSKYVRLSYANEMGYVSCYTCDSKYYWKEMHAGHNQHHTLDFELDNRRPQCNYCNTYAGGKLDIFTRKLVEEFGGGEIGLKKYDDMVVRGKQDQKMDRCEVHEVISKYNELFKKELKKRNLNF